MALVEAGHEHLVVHTGQHYDAQMSAVFFEELGIPAPTHHLELGGLSHGAMTGRMLEALEARMLQARPDWVLVYGDTNSTLAGALAASKLHIPVAHVEAGMRSFNRHMPEEINRILTDHLSQLLLVTSAEPARLLAAEGLTHGVVQVGDVMYDAILHFRERASSCQTRQRWHLPAQGYGVVTLHRAENTDNPDILRGLLNTFNQLSSELPLIFPVHPRTRQRLSELGFQPAHTLYLSEPLSYFEMLDLQQDAQVILTDSGGLQKEAFYLGVPCVTLRAETEWTETVNTGWNALAGHQSEQILKAVGTFMKHPPISGENPYGDGQAAEKIATALSKFER